MEKTSPSKRKKYARILANRRKKGQSDSTLDRLRAMAKGH
jgi:hypothetical protein